MTTHVVTVHWKSPAWIDVQLRELARQLGDDHLVYAFLNEIERTWVDRFFYASREPIETHSIKLNLLGDMVTLRAEPGDLLLFIDGDAFPVAPVGDLAALLPSHPLIAVQRYENAGDIQPHPCFCLTTVGFWREIKGDWSSGFRWTNLHGREVTDVGGNLLEVLEREKVPWLPLRRLNTDNPHPVLFGVYGTPGRPFAYHHGAAFRPPVTRLDVHAAGGELTPEMSQKLGALHDEWQGRIFGDPDSWRDLVGS